MGIAVGVVVTVLAATFPARRATRVPPVAALREALPDTQAVPRRRIISGAVVLVAWVRFVAARSTTWA